MKSDNNGKSNVPGRFSRNFNRELENMNIEREKNGLDSLSKPKMTDLIVKHKHNWFPIRADIIKFKNEK